MRGSLIGLVCIALAACSQTATTVNDGRIEYSAVSIDTEQTKMLGMPESWEGVRKAVLNYDEGRYCNIYYPGSNDLREPKPVVIIYNGNTRNDEEAIKDADGSLFKDLDIIESWGVRFAANDIIAMTYDSFDENPKRGGKTKPSESIDALAAFIDRNAARLGIDRANISILAMGPAATRLQQTLVADKRWLKNVRSVVYNWPILDSGVVARKSPRTLIIRSSKLNPSMLFEIDKTAELLAIEGVPVEVHENKTGGYNYDTLVDDADTLAAIKKVVDFVSSSVE